MTTDGEAPPEGEATLLLRRWRSGEEGARNRLIDLLHDELRLVARRLMRRERAGHTLGATAVVHEAYLRLLGDGAPAADRGQFLGLAAHVMRQVLVDHARQRDAGKRGGDWHRVTLSERDAGPDAGNDASTRVVDALDLNAALERLAVLSPRQAQVAELRHFGGLTLAETAAALGVSDTIVKREWNVARRWLQRELGNATSSDRDDPAK